MSKDFNTVGLEQTRYAPTKPTIKPTVRINNGRKDRRSERFLPDGKAGPGERIVIATDGENSAAFGVVVRGERVVTSRPTLEGSRSKMGRAASTAKTSRFVVSNASTDRTIDHPTVYRPLETPTARPASSKWSYQCRRMVRPV
jgi:hypothetical protein